MTAKRVDTEPADNTLSATVLFLLAMTTPQPDLLILKLIEKLGDRDPITRRNATGALRLQGVRAVIAIPAISALLGDNDARVRREAERALDDLGTAAA
jgi:HEAT repeat protein